MILVKIWSMHNDYSVTTIDAKSNVCCVKFKPDSQYNIVFGTADHNLYYFDLRNTREPCNLLKGHKKAVSYARFLSNNEIVSASTDSQLRLWRVTEGQCLRTYRGHVNEKNFVGLAVSSGYIVCGTSLDSSRGFERRLHCIVQEAKRTQCICTNEKSLGRCSAINSMIRTMEQ